jgi:hypothetical protein
MDPDNEAPPPSKVRRMDSDLDSGGGSDTENIELISQFINDQLQQPFHGFESREYGAGSDDPRLAGQPGLGGVPTTQPSAGGSADARWGNRGMDSKILIINYYIIVC